MSNRLALLAAVLVLVLVASVPALAQNEVPACELEGTCLDASEEQEATAEQYVESPGPGQAPSVPPTPEIPSEDSNDDQYTSNTDNAQNGVPEATLSAPASCGSCGVQVAQSAQEAITGSGDGGTNSANAFGAVVQAARDAGGTREAAASEEAGPPVEETAVYWTAFEAAKEAGADDETAKEAAEQAVTEADSGRAVTGKDRKKRASEGQPREDTINEDAVVSAGEDGSSDSPGSGKGDMATTFTGTKAPLLFGSIAFLSAGGFAALRFARSGSPSDSGLPRN
ncbi:MAG TPA: hypothetical protein VF558_01935 [Rubrobacteraceae bacterium]